MSKSAGFQESQFDKIYWEHVSIAWPHIKLSVWWNLGHSLPPTIWTRTSLTSSVSLQITFWKCPIVQRNNKDTLESLDQVAWSSSGKDVQRGDDSKWATSSCQATSLPNGKGGDSSTSRSLAAVCWKVQRDWRVPAPKCRGDDPECTSIIDLSLEMTCAWAMV